MKRSSLALTYFGESVGENGPGGTLARAVLDLLDAWSDGNATPHERWPPLEEALAVTLADNRPFL
jgi:hypothetical protein